MTTKNIEDYAEVLPLLIEPRFSIDRLTMLIYSPGFSMYESDRNFQDLEGVTVRNKIESFRRFLHDLVLKDSENAEVISYSLETQLYAFHYRINNIDIQFCTKLPKTSRISNSDYVEVWGDEKDKKRGYMYEYYNNDYNIRIEYNPNKADISLLSKILFFINDYFYREYRTPEFIKITRIDFAFDYPQPLNPALTYFTGSRKYNICGGSEGIETVYYGAQKSAYNLTVYNKKKELEEEFNTYYSGPYLWRIELRCHHTWFIQDLPGIGLTVLPRIEVFSSGLSTGEWQMDLILRDAVHWGIKSSLALMPERTRIRYLKFFREYSATKIIHPGDLYLKHFRSIWDLERDKILKTFGFEPSQFCSRAVLDSKL